MMNSKSSPLVPSTIGLVGLGYVGLPLAVGFAEHFQVIGYDINQQRVERLQANIDDSGELSNDALSAAKRARYTCDPEDLADCDVYIITVPTPLNEHRRPDLKALENACADVARTLSKGDLVIVESTVYPGVTEEICIPILEDGSSLKCDRDFDCGYSPERIRPSSDKSDPRDIVKLTAGRTPQAALRVDALYRRIIRPGTHRVSSIQVAEMAKLAENTQRDINIAIMNELALICDTLDIDSAEMFAAAATKWDFLGEFKPGLVGGHCISVDPCYLAERAESKGYKPNLIHAARQINNALGIHVAERAATLLKQRGTEPSKAETLILGVSFKSNCADMRDTRVVDIAGRLVELGCRPTLCDPVVDARSARELFRLDFEASPDEALRKRWDAIILAVGHNAFKGLKTEHFGQALVLDLQRIAPRADWSL